MIYNTITKKRYRLNGISLVPNGEARKVRADLANIFGLKNRVTLHNYVTGFCQPSLGMATAVTEYFEKNFNIKEGVWVEFEPEKVKS